jgi:hypothetical protein
MTEPALRRMPTRWRALVLLATAAALLAGCDLATGTVRTATELQEAGIRNPNLQYDGGVATLEYDADPNPLEARAEQERAARVIWLNLPFRIDQITLVPDGGAVPSRDYPRALLEQRLGPRPADLDRSVEDIARRATLIALVVGLVALVLVIVVIVLVVRAVRRRPAPQPAGAWPQGGGPQPWGQAGWGQPTQPGQQPWGQPAPPGQQPWGAPPGTGQPPDPAWAQPPPAAPAPPGPPPPSAPPPPAPPPPGSAGTGEDWPSGAPRPEAEPPSRGPGDTQRLEPGSTPPAPPREERGPTPPS